MQTKLNIASIVGVKESIRDIFSLIEQSIDAYSHNPSDRKHIETCRIYIHQLNGLLEMLELSNLTNFSNTIEQLVSDLIDKKIVPSQSAVDLLKEALHALLTYLDGLIDGAQENPLKLFPVYRNLMHFLGNEDVTEFELFHPRLITDPPLKPVLDTIEPEQLKTLIKKARAEYQSGLVQWLKTPFNKNGLKQMHHAMQLAEQFPGTENQRMLWWVAVGFLEFLLENKTDIELSTRKRCGKIEQALRHLTEGSLQDTSQLTRELLYHIAQHPATSQHITHIYKAFALPSLSQEQSTELTTPPSQHVHLKAAHDILLQASEHWQAFCAGEHNSLTAFRENMAQLCEHANTIQCSPLQQLAISINDVALSLTNQQTHSSVISENVTIEIASALLHLECIIDNFHQLPDDISEKITALSRQLDALTKTAQAPDEPSDATIPVISIPTTNIIENSLQQSKSHTQIIDEVLTNLQQIEKILEPYFEKPNEQAVISALTTATPLFNQTSGALEMLGLDQAKHLLDLCKNLAKQFSEPTYTLNQTEQTLLVDGLSSLGFFLQTYKNDQSGNPNIINAAIAVFENAAKQKSTSPTSSSDHLNVSAVEFDSKENNTEDICVEPGNDLSPAIKIDGNVDTELLDIFLEEANEILAEIANSILHCQTDHTDIKSLTHIRRGFHTLKGSGRMVKLEFLSEAAWSMEQMLNRWLNDKKLITDELIQLLEYAHQGFSQWCHNLSQTGESEIDTCQLLELIQHLNDALDTEQRTDHQTPSPIDVTQTSVSIGEISIPTDLFEIFVKESKQHLATLNQEMEKLLAAQPATIHKAITLAAHTLASTSHALGLNFISDLSSTLEQWLSSLTSVNAPLHEPDIHLLQNCIQQLDELLQKVFSQQFPDETDLQLAQFLSAEIIKHLTRQQEPEHAASSFKPVNLNEYRLKKTPDFIKTLQPEITPEHAEAYNDAHLDQISTELLQTFLEEGHEIIPQINAKLRSWRILPQSEDIRISLLRLLHTLKGSAHMIGAEQISAQIHSMENEVELAFSKAIVSAYSIDKVEYDFDQLCEKIEQLQKHSFAEETPHITDALDTIETIDVPVIAETTEKNKAEIIDQTTTTDITAPVAPTSLISTTNEIETEETSQSGNFLRVNANQIDHLVNESGEAGILNTKIELQLNNFKQSLNDLTESADRLHNQLREVVIQAETQMQSHLAQQRHNNTHPFDPLEFDRFTRFQELTRLMTESVDDIITVQKNLSTIHSATAESIAQQAIINKQLQQLLVHIRTVSFGSISERYYRVVRKTANELGKKVNLTIHGEEIEIDRSVLEKISASLEHLLRNAIAHGIEQPDQRIQQGKPETGQIIMDLRQEDNEVMITVNDDGCGLNLENIRKEAIKMALIPDNISLDDDQIAAFIFSPGLTTHTHVTGTAGRGIGMNIVQNDISSLGGQITVKSEKNQGTVFHIQLPLTLAVAQTLMVVSGKQTIAIPVQIVTHVHELNEEALQSTYQNHQIVFDGESYPFTHLSFLLDQHSQKPEAKKYNRVLLLRRGDLRLAVHIDDLIGNREVVVKNIGPQIMNAPGVEGATVTGEGKPALILNPLKLLQRNDIQKILKTPVSELIAASKQKTNTTATILVVDDSLTIRKVTSRLLEREGYTVLTAKQGIEALAVIKHTKPDVMLIDLEMPKMNGFELIQHIRAHPETDQIPIIIISSRTAEKHRVMAKQLGANVFLGKPYKEEVLLESIQQFIPAKN